MAVTPRGIVTPDGTEDWDLVVDLNAMADSIDDALDTIDTDLANDLTAFAATRAIRTYKWANAAARTAQAGMTEGDVGDQADTDQRWRYSGSAWVNITSGLFPVIPTSVVGGTVAAGGRVTFTGVTNLSLNGCFTSAYDNYVVVFDLATAGAGTLSIVMRAAGTDSTTGYDSQRLLAQNTTTASAQTLNAANWVGSGGVGIAGGQQVGEMRFFSPARAVGTVARVDNTITANPMTTTSGLYMGSLLHRPATAYDGFSLMPSTSTFTGTLTVYGYNRA